MYCYLLALHYPKVYIIWLLILGTNRRRLFSPVSTYELYQDEILCKQLKMSHIGSNLDRFCISFTMWELETQANHCRDTHSPWSRSVPLLFFYYLSDWFDSDRFSQQGRIVSCRGYHSYKDVTIDYMVLNDGRHLGVSVLVKLICEGGEGVIFRGKHRVRTCRIVRSNRFMFKKYNIKKVAYFRHNYDTKPF